MRVLYFDCSSGAAGDMLMGALLDAGAPLDVVRSELASLNLDGWELEVEQVRRAAIRAAKVNVRLANEPVVARSYTDVVGLLERASLGSEIRRLALDAIGRLGRAEAKVHGEDLGRVHLHEVGAVDAIVDIVGSCAALVSLQADQVVTSAIRVGSGTVATEHGDLPVPAPAVAAILHEAGAAFTIGGPGELLTPTGAAILAAVSDRFGDPPAMELDAIGYGAGDRDHEAPNVVRVMIGTVAQESATPDQALLLETNIDDMAPELFPYVIERLLAAGGLDAWVEPVTMKKGRIGFKLSVLAPEQGAAAMTDVLFSETTTLGVRFQTVGREVLDREWVQTEVEGHPVRVKVGRRGSEVVTASVEFEDAAAAARATGLPLRDIYARALAFLPNISPR